MSEKIEVYGSIDAIYEKWRLDKTEMLLVKNGKKRTQSQAKISQKAKLETEVSIWAF